MSEQHFGEGDVTLMRWKYLVFLLCTMVFLLGCAQTSPETSPPAASPPASLAAEFSILTPSAGSSIVNRTPTLAWKCSIEAASYKLQVSIDKNFGKLVVDEAGLSSTSYNIPAGKLTHDRTYYWRVNATSGGKTSAWSEVWSFRTVFLP
jgi:hypothetical protein